MSAAPSETMPIADVAAMMDRLWRDMISLPWPQVCRHLMADMVIREMETIGIAPPAEVIEAITRADDITALAWCRSDILDASSTDNLKGTET